MLFRSPVEDISGIDCTHSVRPCCRKLCFPLIGKSIWATPEDKGMGLMIAILFMAGNSKVRVTIAIKIAGYTPGAGMVEQVLYAHCTEIPVIVLIQIG